MDTLLEYDRQKSGEKEREKIDQELDKAEEKRRQARKNGDKQELEYWKKRCEELEALLDTLQEDSIPLRMLRISILEIIKVPSNRCCPS